MTYTEEFIPTESDEELNETSDYPTAFGITFTPVISGALIGVLGLLGAAYLVVNQVLPTWEKYQEVQTKVEDTQAQIQQKQGSQQKFNAAQAKLEAAKQQRKQVLALFSTEKTLDTLLLDLNRFIASRQGQLQSFVPDQQAATVVTDNSFGPGVNGKLKSKSATIQLEGSFDQIQSIMRSIERLQPLLIFRDFQTQVGTTNPQKFVIDRQGKAVSIGQPTLTTTFKLQALVPLTAEEQQQAAAAAAPPPAK